MTKPRSIEDLSPEERERIVCTLRGLIHQESANMIAHQFAGEFNVSEDTVRQVLREEGE